MKITRTCSAFLFALSLLFAAVPTALCSCKQEPETPDCGPKTYTFYGNQATDAIDQLYEKRRKIKAEDSYDVAPRWLQQLKEAPVPATGLFRTTARDDGAKTYHVELSLVYQYNQHFEVDYRYPRAILPVTNSESGETTDYPCHIQYRFYRLYTYEHRILQTVDEYYQYYYSQLEEHRFGQMIDGKLYVSDAASDRLYFDLNPGIGVVEVLDNRDGMNIPYETLLPLCRWELIPVYAPDRENVTEHVGWW